MKDERHVFFEDVREKAITARSSKKKPHRGGCRIPQYTAKEIREMSGPVHKIDLGKPIAYADFKAQPETLQKEYVKNILANYKVGMSAIAELLGVPVSTCTSRLHKLGFSFPRGFKPIREDLERFREDFGLTERVAPTKKMTLENVQLCFTGIFDAGQLAKQLRAFVPENQLCRISIAVEVVEPEPSATEPATVESA